ncbi:MAG TPA: D-alanyl-D-alanine carboxypeptidase/D-alanyl-D-alanine-endopeptidase, partial [Chromatiales bacterium]|nr:D-alanyl-D-alanine carboxypeptidase/D-alanyl-D-alanine-endopeptidase [Chromatiales bacterium]
LVFVGAGDPGLTWDSLWELAAGAAAQAGLRRVRGDLVVDQSRLGAVPCATSDRCRALHGSDHAYNAPLSSAGVNYGAWCVWVRPAPAAGHRAAAGLCPPVVPGTALVGGVRTTARGYGAHVELWRTTEAGVDTLHIGGAVSAALPTGRYYVSASDPARLTGVLLRSLLAARGVRVDGRVRVVSHPLANLEPLVAVKGPTLGHEISVMMHYSNDYMADVLALDLVRERAGDADPPLLADAGAALGRFAAAMDRAARIPGAAPRGTPVIASGSGLTPANRLSADDVVALLTRMYHSPALFPSYLAALSVPRGAPMRMLRGGNRVWLTQTAVKTGSMNEPVSVLGVAGYFRTRDGGWGAFAVLVNGTRRRPHFAWYQAMAAIEHDIARLAAAR